MAWMEVHQELRSHPKVARLASGLGVSKAQALGHVIALWTWAIAYASDGDLTGYSAVEIVDACLSDAPPEKLMQCLIDAGWIDNGAVKRIHDWDEMGTKFLNSGRERKERYNSNKQTEAERSGNVPVTSTQPNPTQPNPTKPNQQQQPRTETEPPTQQAAAADAGLEQVIYDRIGWKKRLSRFDWDKVLALKNKHGPQKFRAALDKLHGGVTNVPAYLSSILEPDTRVESDRQRLNDEVEILRQKKRGDSA